MTNQALTLEAMLAIPASEPERLFSGDRAALPGEWRTLATRWHPDRHPKEPRATELFQHLNALHAEAVRRLAAGIWENAGSLRLDTINGRRVELMFLAKSAFELGECYVGEDFAAFSIASSERDLFERAFAMLEALPYSDAAMRAEMSHHLPRVETALVTAARLVLVVSRTPGRILLADLLAHQGGRLDPKHAAWIVSGLLNIACYLDWAGLVHGAIGPHSVFVSPESHSVSLLGGWWYATRRTGKFVGLPERSVQALPPAVGLSGIAANAVDLELVRLTAREMLGDPTGLRLLHDKHLPRPLARWLSEPPAATAQADYRAWEAVRETSFGPRRFIKLDVSAKAVYPPRAGRHPLATASGRI